MKYEQIQHLIAEGLLAYFRPGQSVPGVQIRRIEFAGTRRLLRFHWAIGPEVQSMLEYFLQRHGEMISNPTTRLLETRGSIRGPGNWPATIVRRQLTGIPNLTVYRNVRRSFAAGPNRVLLYVISSALQALDQITRRAGLLDSPYGEAIQRSAELAIRAQRIVELRQIRDSRVWRSGDLPNARDLQQAAKSSRRIYVLAARQMKLLLELSKSPSQQSIANFVDDLIAPLRQWQQFELFAVLRVGLALGNELEIQPEIGDLSGLVSGPAIRVGPLDVYWGIRPRGVKFSGQLGPERAEVRRVLSKYGIANFRGRPDITIVDREHSQVISVVECKYSSIETINLSRQFRDAVYQLVEYSGDFCGDPASRLRTSAIAMFQIPEIVARTRESDCTTVPAALDARDLQLMSPSVRNWAAKVCRQRSPSLQFVC